MVFSASSPRSRTSALNIFAASLSLRRSSVRLSACPSQPPLPIRSHLKSRSHTQPHPRGHPSPSGALLVVFLSPMPASEIDEIFASKRNPSSAAAPAASSSVTSSQDLEKKKKKKKKDTSAKRKRDDEHPDADANTNAHADLASRPLKRNVPETVFDPSAALPSVKESKTRKADKAPSTVPKPKKPHKDREEEERFKDSRGTGPRRRTEEGYAIYKEDELGITDQGGDTPLCPFDCQCCF
ncbi:hypothetical protein BD414DRAFT_243982 [Trametes punicea]|nr:hypothetical protein BD414DRAFT_243982 [Trametes punicea]